MNARYFFISSFAGLLALSPLESALPPLAQSTREIQAILADPKMQSLFGSADSLEEIRRTEEGYALLTRRRMVLVAIEYLPSGKKVGPASFELHFGEPISLGAR